MKLYPKLPVAVAHEIALSAALTPIRNLEAGSAVDHPAAVYSPIGGTRARNSDLTDLQAALRACARDNGYPAAPTEGARVTFDAGAARLLTVLMDISANEAADPRLWAFLACIVMPDLVRWRFPGGPSGTSSERFIGEARGLRNTFGRLWWRSHLLRVADGGRDPLGLLGEDELVQITERPSVAGSPRLASQLADTFLEATDRYPTVSRSVLMRDAMKRIRRLDSFVDFDALEDEVLVELVDDVFESSARTAMPTSGHGGRDPKVRH